MSLAWCADILSRLGAGEVACPLNVFFRTVVGLAQLGVAHGDEDKLRLRAGIVKAEEVVGLLCLHTEALRIDERPVIAWPPEIDDRWVGVLHGSTFLLLGSLFLRLLGKECLLLYRGDALVEGLSVGRSLLIQCLDRLLEFLLGGEEVEGTFLVLVILLADSFESVLKPCDGGSKEEKG